MDGEETCRKGTFSDIFGPMEATIKVSHLESTSLMTIDHKDGFLLHHWTQYMETHSGCSGTWSGYSTYEFNTDGEVERMLSFSENSHDVMACIGKYHHENEDVEDDDDDDDNTMHPREDAGEL